MYQFAGAHVDRKELHYPQQKQKEILFIVYLLRHMKTEVELPICVNVDNIGVIFLAENQNSSDHTKHVDIRYHFIRQYIKDGTIMVEFVRSSENDSDIFTKNVTSETFNRHRLVR